jgi:hypothetical protein
MINQRAAKHPQHTQHTILSMVSIITPIEPRKVTGNTLNTAYRPKHTRKDVFQFMRLNIATPAAWCINTSAPLVLVIIFPGHIKNVRDITRFCCCALCKVHPHIVVFTQPSFTG